MIEKKKNLRLNRIAASFCPDLANDNSGDSLCNSREINIISP